MTQDTDITIIYNGDNWTEKTIGIPLEANMKVLAKEAGIQSGFVSIYLKQNETWIHQKVDNVVVPDGFYSIMFGNEVKLTLGEKYRQDYIEHEKQRMGNEHFAIRKSNSALLLECLDDLEL